MSRYTTIIGELEQINDAKFQIICDLFLSSEFKDDFTSIGSVIGKEKTKKGKPDSFLRSQDGYYILAEYTTRNKKNKKSFLNKLESDLRDCLDLTNLKISKNQVKLIILCCNSNLEISENVYLTEIASAEGFKLRIISITTLAMFLFSKGKQTAKDLLGIAIDSGQVLKKREFLQQYHRKNISTPLDNTLYGREGKLAEIKNEIINKNIVIITGAPGVGKSRLALKGIDEFLIHYSSYTPYYIVQKNNSIADDLSSDLEEGENYLLFIDDANRQIDNLLSILNSFVEKKEDRIKIIMTVRDYAKSEIIEKCYGFNPSLIFVEKLTDDVIRQILRSEDFKIVNESLIERIVEISKGNARLAIMSAKIISLNPNINLLKDVSVIYDEYYHTYINDKEIFKNINALKVLGLLSFFFAMDMRSDSEKRAIKRFNITHESFVEIAYTLEDLELVDIYEKETVKISEQILSTYFFYKVFIKEKLLNFGLLLNEFFRNYEYRMKDCFEAANSAFGNENVLEKVRTELSNHWRAIKDDNEQASKFLNIFGKYFPNQTFSFALKEIEKMPETSEDNIQFDNLGRSFGYFKTIRNVLENFFESNDRYELLTSIKLSIDYARKIQDSYSDMVKSLENPLIINEDDVLNNLSRQEIVFEELVQLVSKSKIYRHVFYHIHSKNLLNCHYIQNAYCQDSEGVWEIIAPLQKLRERFWLNLIDFYHEPEGIIYHILITYIDQIQNSNDVLLRFDYPFIILLIAKRLSKESFADCVFVHNYFDKAVETGFVVDRPDLRAEFLSPAYKTCMILSRSRSNGVSIKRNFDYEKLESYKKKEYKKELPILSLNEFKIIYNHIKESIAYTYAAKYDLIPPMDIFFASVIEDDLPLGFEILRYYLGQGNVAGMQPFATYKKIFGNGKEWGDKLYTLISTFEFEFQEIWQERYFYFIPDELLNPRIIEDLVNFYKKSTTKLDLYAGHLDRFLALDQDIYIKILRLFTEKHLKDKKYKYHIGYNFFSDSPKIVSDQIGLSKTVYLQQIEIDKNYDPDCSEFIVLFNVDNNFCNEYLDHLISFKEYSFYGSHITMAKLWAQPGGEKAIYQGLVKFSQIENIYFFDHIGTVFFVNLGETYFANAVALLRKFLREFKTNLQAINLVLDIGRNCIKQFYLDLIKDIVVENSDITFFKKLRLYNSHFSSTGEIIWADFKAAELRNIYEAIKGLPQSLDYILHLEYLETQVGYEEADANRERKNRFIGYG